MANSPREVFDLFTREVGEDYPPEAALLAFGAFSAELYEWMQHEEARAERALTPEDVNAWVAQIPEPRLKRIRDEALESFGLAARSFLEPEIQRQREEAVNASILAEVKSLVASVRGYTSGWRSFGLNIL